MQFYDILYKDIEEVMDEDWDGKLFKHDKIEEIDISNISRVEYRSLILNQEYNIRNIKKVGQGGFSTVYKVKYNNKLQAYKKFNCGGYYRDDGIDSSNLTEMSLLKTISNSNILELIYVKSYIKNDLNCYGLILEYLDQDLKDYLNSISSISDHIFKRFSLQLLNSESIYIL